ncbi:SulP family inorganic anion transporter [Candidatus Berkiella aquae]|uniref:C4-dicarboxylic acid transporter DauA n=1 Tax=Candidatus Berkiella aquae TaxID=295108 RepID=A0A0Q9YVU2_9GAMM|nr:SulP family inorganic anion transporter [Candidatus Berkiella aquae]MCS5710040.1 sodium-independent anion transporter [Candidatus Berkiella aquae]
MLKRTIGLLPIGWALRQSLEKGYTWQDFRADFGAALVVSLIALPLSMALAIAVGLAPEHGIYTAIVAGIAAALLGGSLFQISGPTAAFVVILIPIVTQLGLRGIIWCQILAGFILIMLGFAKIGQLIHRVPYAVTTGFTTGIAIVLATLSLKDFLGINMVNTSTHYADKVANLFENLPHTQWPTAIVGTLTMLAMVNAKRLPKFIPAPILGILIGALVAWFLNHFGYTVATIGSEFSYRSHDGNMHMGVPPFAPSLHLPTLLPNDLFTIPSLAELKILIFPALIIATLVALESLLSAAIADSLTQTKHQPNAELKGIGVANILCGLASGIPATAAIARTAANIHSGAKSPIACILHSLLILLYVLLFTPLICYIPMTTLAAILLITAYRMSHLEHFIKIIRHDVFENRTILLSCCLTTVFIDMVAGIGLGMALAGIFYIRNRMKNLFRI